MDYVLIIEDNGMLRKSIADSLDCATLGAHSYASALDKWEEYKNEIKCIVVDLSIPALGLTNDEICHYRPFFGMAFIDKIIKDESNEDSKKALRKKIVIYSAFVRQLKADVRSQKGSAFNLDSITLVDKGYAEKSFSGSNSSSIVKLKSEVTKIMRQNQ